MRHTRSSRLLLGMHQEHSATENNATRTTRVGCGRTQALHRVLIPLVLFVGSSSIAHADPHPLAVAKGAGTRATYKNTGKVGNVVFTLHNTQAGDRKLSQPTLKEIRFHEGDSIDFFARAYYLATIKEHVEDIKRRVPGATNLEFTEFSYLLQGQGKKNGLTIKGYTDHSFKKIKNIQSWNSSQFDGQHVGYKLRRLPQGEFQVLYYGEFSYDDPKASGEQGKVLVFRGMIPLKVVAASKPLFPEAPWVGRASNVQPKLLYSRADLDVVLARETKGFGPVGKPHRLRLDVTKQIKFKAKKGYCYRVSVILDSDAVFAPDVMQYMPFTFIERGKAGTIDGGPGIHGPGGIGGAGCPYRNGSYRFQLGQRKHKKLGKGGYTAQVYARKISRKALAKLKRGEKELERKSEAFHRKYVRKQCRSCKWEFQACMKKRTNTLRHCKKEAYHDCLKPAHTIRDCKKLGGIKYSPPREIR